mmetsp:Transcript_7017/g.11303  ORF Transcript_7017/g.11303 Transcript_7017/m.11303 type:complete len:523 (-) Transcript_7017:58-1626(-)
MSKNTDVSAASLLNQLVPWIPGTPLKVGQKTILLTKNYMGLNFFAQAGKTSPNSKNNDHWNDVLIYSVAGSHLNFSGMDFVNKRSLEDGTYGSNLMQGKRTWDICCFMKCNEKLSVVSQISTTTTFTTLDEKHSIKVKHIDGIIEKLRGCCAGCCEDCFPISPLCFSQCCCTVCCIEKMNWSTYVPEKFEVSYDGEAVGTVTVTIGKGKGQYAGRLVRQTAARKADQENAVWVMNDVEQITDGVETPTYHCCACGNCCDCCVPCCCPICLPIGGCNIKCSSCKCCTCCKCCKCCTKCCNCCTKCCDAMCLSCSGCCFTCSQCIIKCPNFCHWLSCTPCVFCGWLCRTPCVKCGIEETTTIEEKWERYMPADMGHKVHRHLYELTSLTQQTGSTSQRPYGWIAYTEACTAGSNVRVPRTSLAMPKQSDFDTHNLELLLSLPLLMDLGLGVLNVHRSEWTLAPRVESAVLEPTEVVNWWPEPEILTTCVHQFKVDDFHSESASLLSAPEPVTMGASAPTGPAEV